MRQRKPGVEAQPEPLDFMLNKKSIEESPRQMRVTLLLWLTHVTPDRGHIVQARQSPPDRLI